jgi:hypothetical protein
MEGINVNAKLNRATARLSMLGLFLLTSFILVGCGPESYQAHFLVSWSPDGSSAAIVPNILDNKIPESDVWLFDRASGKLKSVYHAEEGYACFQPQWSPFDRELLFGVFQKDGDDDKSHGTLISLWLVTQEGYRARKVAETVINDDGDSILLPNGIAWGPYPGTIIFEERIDDHSSTAVMLDLCTGKRQSILPRPAAQYSIEISPSRKLIAAVLMGREEDPVELWVADFAEPIWRRLGYVAPDPDLIGQYTPLIYWAPDSASILVPESEKSPDKRDSRRYFMRWIDVETGGFKRTETGQINAPLRWKNASELFYSADNGEERSGIFKLNLRTGDLTPVATGEEVHLLAWDAASNALNFYSQESVKNGENKESHLFHFFYCSESGSDLREIMSPLATDDLGWTVSPDGRQVMLFSTDHPVISLDLPHGLKRRNLTMALKNK